MIPPTQLLALCSCIGLLNAILSNQLHWLWHDWMTGQASESWLCWQWAHLYLLSSVPDHSFSLWRTSIIFIPLTPPWVTLDRLICASLFPCLWLCRPCRIWVERMGSADFKEHSSTLTVISQSKDHKLKCLRLGKILWNCFLNGKATFI